MADPEDKAEVIETGIVHYLHRRWASNGITTCGIHVAFHAPLAEHRVFQKSRYLVPDSPERVTCLECLAMQEAR